MKIALVVPGGVDRSGTHRVIPALLWLIQRLAHEHEVHVFSLFQEPRPGRWQLRGASIHNIGRDRTRRRAVAAIRAEHRNAPFDALHAFWATPAGVIAGAAGHLIRRPVLLHLLGGELVAFPDIGYGERRTRRGRAWVRLALATARRVAAPSEPLCLEAERMGVTAVRIPLGVDTAEWPPRPPRPRDPAAPARLIHVASLNRVKDQDTLVQAAAALARMDVPFTLDFVGTDTLGGDAKHTAAALGIADRVRFHGFLPHHELRPLVDRADLLVMASRHEGGPVALLEAAVAGVPAVGTDVGHFHEWAPNAAVAVPPGDFDALAREIATLLHDDPRRLAIAAAAQARALAEDADLTARLVHDLYREMTARPT